MPARKHEPECRRGPKFEPSSMPAAPIRSSRSAPFRQPRRGSGPQRCGHRGHRRSVRPTHRDLARVRAAATCAGRSQSARRPGGLGWRVAPPATGTVVDADSGVIGDGRRYPAEGGGHVASARFQHDCGAPCASAVQVQPVTAADVDQLARPSGTRLHPGARARSRSPRPPRQEPSSRSPGRAAIDECGYAAADGPARSSRSPAPAAREATPSAGHRSPRSRTRRGEVRTRP